ADGRVPGDRQARGGREPQTERLARLHEQLVLEQHHLEARRAVAAELAVDLAGELELQRARPALPHPAPRPPLAVTGVVLHRAHAILDPAVEAAVADEASHGHP